jgi:hypothetical protein
MNIQPRPPKAYISQEEQFLLEDALAALQNTTGIIGRTVATEPDLETGARTDAVIELAVGDQLQRYAVEIKRVDRFAAIGQIKQQLDNFGQLGLLIAPRITTEMADKCRELDVQFIDTNGNVFLHAPGLFVWVKGQRPRANEAMTGATRVPPRGGTPTALRIIFILLCRPELLNAPYREIKQAAGVALGAIGWIFLDLNARGFTIGGKNKGERRMLERQRLLEEWVTNYPIKLRPKLNPKRFHAPDPNWWRQTDITRYDAQWGGEVAAEKLTGHLRPDTVTIYMRPEDARKNLTKMVVENKLRADPVGKIEVLTAFWDFPGNATKHDIVPPLLVYADLLATIDPRNHETARMIYEEKIRDFNAKA